MGNNDEAGGREERKKEEVRDGKMKGGRKEET